MYMYNYITGLNRNSLALRSFTKYKSSLFLLKRPKKKSCTY